jgi:hypothetical protein
MGLSPDRFRLIPQEKAINPVVGGNAIVQNVPRSPAGTFRSGRRRSRVTYDPDLVTRPMDLVATFAHELCHALLQTKGRPPGGNENDEFATDLAVTFSVSASSAQTPLFISASFTIPRQARRAGQPGGVAILQSRNGASSWRFSHSQPTPSISGLQATWMLDPQLISEDRSNI